MKRRWWIMVHHGWFGNDWSWSMEVTTNNNMWNPALLFASRWWRRPHGCFVFLSIVGLLEIFVFPDTLCGPILQNIANTHTQKSFAEEDTAKMVHTKTLQFSGQCNGALPTGMGIESMVVMKLPTICFFHSLLTHCWNLAIVLVCAALVTELFYHVAENWPQGGWRFVFFPGGKEWLRRARRTIRRTTKPSRTAFSVAAEQVEFFSNSPTQKIHH